MPQTGFFAFGMTVTVMVMVCCAILQYVSHHAALLPFEIGRPWLSHSQGGTHGVARGWASGIVLSCIALGGVGGVLVLCYV